MAIHRNEMIDLMQVKGLSKSTQKSYLYGVDCYEKYARQAIDQLSPEDLQKYMIHLVKNRRLSGSSVRLQLQSVRFYYIHVLKQERFDIKILTPKREQRIPDLLTRTEALAIVNAPIALKYQTQLKLCYSCGIRIGEMLALRVKNIDGERRLLKIINAKGNKDRFVPLTEEMLYQLRRYWCEYRPDDLLFYSSPHRDRPMSPTAVSKTLKKVKQTLGITKQGSIHSLRHAFATHQLEAGLPLHLLQRWLGHTDIRTTMRYIHWVPGYQDGENLMIDLLHEGNFHGHR